MMNLQSRPIAFPQPMRLRFSVDEYYKMIDLGLIKNSEKAEIIDGELIKKMTIGEKHASAVNFLNRFFSRRLDDSILVSVQNPLRLSDFDEPEPDIVLADLTKYDGMRHPRANETILVVEVSDTTLKYDRDTKLPLYAEAGIQEVWIVNLIADIIEVHQNPSNGLYQLTNIYSHGDTLTSQVVPNLSLNVDEILG